MELFQKSQWQVEHERKVNQLFGLSSDVEPQPELGSRVQEFAGDFLADFFNAWGVNTFRDSAAVVEAATRRVMCNTPVGEFDKAATYREVTETVCESLQKTTETVVKYLKEKAEKVE